MYLEIKKREQLLQRQNDPSPYTLLGWLRYLDGENITDLVLASPTVRLIMSVRGAEINLTFSGDAITNPRNVTVSRATAVEMALYFLKNEGLPHE